MEIWLVVGYRKVDFTDPQGRTVQGYNLFLTRPGSSPSIVGLETQKIFISCQYVDYVPVENQLVSITFNRYGKVSSVAPCED